MVITKVSLRQLAELLVEGSRKHQIAMIIILIDISLKLVKKRQTRYAKALTSSRHDSLEFILPVGVKHFIGLINDRVPTSLSVPLFASMHTRTCFEGISLPNTAKRQDVSLRHKIEKTTRSRNENIASLLKLFTLKARRSTAISNTGTEHRSVAKTASIVKDLSCQFTSRADDQNQGLGSNSVLSWGEGID
jgi:hypothetical protein